MTWDPYGFNRNPNEPVYQGPNQNNWAPSWSRPDEQISALIDRPGDLPLPGNDRWGKAKLLAPGESYTFVQVGMQPMIGPMGIQIEFSRQNQLFFPTVPVGGAVVVTVTKAVDVKSGQFVEPFQLIAGESLPFCTVIAKALTITILNEIGSIPIWIHAAACPVTAVDCESLTLTPTSPWVDVVTNQFPADTVGAFVGLPASSAARQVMVQNNAGVDLLLGFGSLIPALGPPPVYNIILPGSTHAIFESQLGAFTGAIHGIFGGGGLATDYAVFTRGIS